MNEMNPNKMAAGTCTYDKVIEMAQAVLRWGSRRSPQPTTGFAYRAPKGSPHTEGNGSSDLRCVVFWVPVWRKPEHRRALGGRPEGVARRDARDRPTRQGEPEV